MSLDDVLCVVRRNSVGLMTTVLMSMATVTALWSVPSLRESSLGELSLSDVSLGLPMRNTAESLVATAGPDVAHTAILGVCVGLILGGGLVSLQESVGAAVRGHALSETMRTLPVLAAASLPRRRWCGASGQYREDAFGSCGCHHKALRTTAGTARTGPALTEPRASFRYWSVDSRSVAPTQKRGA
ncbi:MAG TPA: hypothetical protein H9871_12815 [Candidatus Nesterenkonia stercoripullorum]|uniref:Uncharacterized protein n=1 Tax=Candidatus Nesterenkonia stercoripullorum TaxID=2838701 RepID=A0A9D1UV61_9MICC|nr:hypothetical protein [Candidatus Nesterenkonia stercoripullorum]